jgi:sporulation protein YlmC with PRC-barrel domain
MKTNIWKATWAAVLAAGLVSSGASLRAAEGKVRSQDSNLDTRAIDQTFKNVERADKLIGKQVRSSDDQKLGKVDNLVLDLESGRVLYAVVGSGGILGAGEKKVAVAPGVFTETQGDNLRLNVDKQKFISAPEFTKAVDKPAELGKAAFVKDVYSYFGQGLWWQGSASPSEGTFNNVHKADDLIGMKVQSVADQPMGKVDKLAVDLPAGRVVFVVLAPDRSLELGNNLYALPPNALTLGTDRKHLTADISKEKLGNAPHFPKDSWPNLSNAAFASQVYQYYGKQAYFEREGQLRPTGREKERLYREQK